MRFDRANAFAAGGTKKTGSIFMAEITAITPQVKDKERCNIYIDGSFYCGLRLETVLQYRLKAGDPIDIARLDEIQLESEKAQALDKAMALLSASMKTEKQICEYLKKKGYVGAVCDYVLEKLCGYGFVDDGEYCEQYVRTAGRNKGRRLIAAELKKRGAAEEAIGAALENREGEEDAAKEVLVKYMKNREFSRENLTKAYRHLLAKGFDYDTAKDALASLGTEEED